VAHSGGVWEGPPICYHSTVGGGHAIGPFEAGFQFRSTSVSTLVRLLLGHRSTLVRPTL